MSVNPKRSIKKVEHAYIEVYIHLKRCQLHQVRQRLLIFVAGREDYVAASREVYIL